jgi:hypothetical protein
MVIFEINIEGFFALKGKLSDGLILRLQDCPTLSRTRLALTWN